MSPDEFDDLVELPVQVLKVVFLQTSFLDHGLDALLLLVLCPFINTARAKVLR